MLLTWGGVECVRALMEEIDFVFTTRFVGVECSGDMGSTLLAPNT